MYYIVTLTRLMLEYCQIVCTFRALLPLRCIVLHGEVDIAYMQNGRGPVLTVDTVLLCLVDIFTGCTL